MRFQAPEAGGSALYHRQHGEGVGDAGVGAAGAAAPFGGAGGAGGPRREAEGGETGKWQWRRRQNVFHWRCGSSDGSIAGAEKKHL